ncbi:hypothetical protein [Paenibacillus humicus]|uniref:hypothetical protein n=1 Tax=Paenibacillus humicus TaxID=412861 RepID=UPI003D2CF154
MALPDKLNSLPDWSNKASNRWADFIELSCIKNVDHIFSIHDMLDHYSDERPEDLERGSQEHSAKYDQIVVDMENYFELIKFRSESLEDYYPFELDDSWCITLKNDLNDNHLFYLFLLLASNLAFFDGSTRYALTHAFEDLCCDILEAISSPLAVTEVFGTSRLEEDDSYRGNLKKRLRSLASNLCANTTKSLDSDSEYDVPGGDGGLDLVSYVPIDGMPFIPVSLAQCACSYDQWQNKQLSISDSIWRARYGNLAPYLQFTFVPFYYRKASGDFENLTTVFTCLIDRHRIFKVIRYHQKAIENFRKHTIYNKVSDLALA